MTEKYLYFAKKTARAQTFTASTSGTTYRLTTGDFIDPLPDGVANTNTLFANGAVTMTLTAHANHTFGTAYNSPSATDIVVVKAEALSYDGVQDVTVTDATTDPINGITLDTSTVGNNDAVFTINVPMLAGDCLLQKASQFKGVEMVDNDTADIYFEPHTNDGLGNGVDKVRLSYTAGNFKLLCDSINALLTDERNKAGLVVVADDYRSIFLNNNITGVTAIDSITLDS